jgi:very-short-patch-repair endonuclease
MTRIPTGLGDSEVPIAASRCAQWVVKLHLFADFAVRNHGLITLDHARHLGISRSAWYRAIEQDLVEPLHPGVARLWGSAPSLTQSALAAVFAAGDGAMCSHRTAVALLGVERPEDDPIDLMLPDRRGRLQLAGVTIHRPRDHLDLTPISRSRVPVTNPMRCLLDLGAVDEAAVYDAMIAIFASKAASPAAVRGALVRHAKRGRHGVTALREALERWLGEDLAPDSLLEARMAELIREHALPPVTFHALIAGFEVDFLIAGTRIVLECDGWGVHGLQRDQFEFDRIRDATLTAAGYVVVHFTWRQLERDPQSVAMRIRNVVAQWAPGLLAPGSGSLPSPASGTEVTRKPIWDEVDPERQPLRAL